jgi:hypothetical protein
MDYFFQILVDQTSMLVDKIIDPILVFQTVNSVPIQDVVAVVLVLPAARLWSIQIVINNHAASFTSEPARSCFITD